MSGSEPGGDWSSDTPEVIDWGPTERDLGLQWAAAGEADLTIPEDMWDAPKDPPPEPRPDLYVVPPPIPVSRPDQSLDPAALDALVEMDGEPRIDRPAAPPRRQWRPGRAR